MSLAASVRLQFGSIWQVSPCTGQDASPASQASPARRGSQAMDTPPPCTPAGGGTTLLRAHRSQSVAGESRGLLRGLSDRSGSVSVGGLATSPFEGEEERAGLEEAGAGVADTADAFNTVVGEVLGGDRWVVARHWFPNQEAPRVAKQAA